MATLQDKIEAELENMDRVLSELPTEVPLYQLSVLEIAGVATLLHNLYNGVENILKQLLLAKDIHLPQGASWYRDLLNLASEKEIISNETKEMLKEYLAFRHFFSHAYALDLFPDRMEPLVENVSDVYKAFRKDIGY